MAQERKQYWLARGKARELVLQYVEDEARSRRAYNALREEVGASEVFVGGTFNFSGEVPPGFKRYARAKKGRGLYRPDKDTPQGKAIQAKVAAVPGYPSWGTRSMTIYGYFARSLGFSVVGDAVYLVGRQGWDDPEGCEKVKTSTYWIMVEHHERKQDPPESPLSALAAQGVRVRSNYRNTRVEVQLNESRGSIERDGTGLKFSTLGESLLPIVLAAFGCEEELIETIPASGWRTYRLDYADNDFDEAARFLYDRDRYRSFRDSMISELNELAESFEIDESYRATIEAAIGGVQ